MYHYQSFCLFLPPHNTTHARTHAQQRSKRIHICYLQWGSMFPIFIRLVSERLLLPHFLRAAVRALVVLYVFRSGGGDPHTLAVEPPLAYVAANPELV